MSNLDEIFWTNDPSILFDWNKLAEIIPRNDMSSVQKLNALSRLILFGGIITYLYQMDFVVLMITGIGLFIVHLLNKRIEEFKEDYNEGEVEYDENNVKCHKISEDNPFMNVMPDDYDNKPNREKACSHSSEKIKKKVENAFYKRFPRDTNDLYGRNNSFRQFYSMPATTIPNDRESFQKWTYNLPKTCKEGGIIPKRDSLFNN